MLSPTHDSPRNYRIAAVQEASPAGLVVILYDLLVEDLQAAAQAIRNGEIEERSLQLKHALLVLQILEGSLDMERGGAAARSLAAFYAYLRGQLLDVQFRNDEQVLTHQIALIFDVREAWRTVDAPAATASATNTFSPALTAQYLDDIDVHEPSQWLA
jgi:flagellar protein FliS